MPVGVDRSIGGCALLPCQARHGNNKGAIPFRGVAPLRACLGRGASTFSSGNQSIFSMLPPEVATVDGAAELGLRWRPHKVGSPDIG